MSDQKLYKTMTMQELIDDLDIIECFGHSGHRTHCGDFQEAKTTLRCVRRRSSFIGINVWGIQDV